MPMHYWPRSRRIPALPTPPEDVELPGPVVIRVAKLGPAGGLDGGIAAGLLLRFGSPSVESLLAGHDPVADHVEAWIAALAPEATARLRELVWASLDGLHARLDDVEAAFNPGDPYWIFALQDLVRGRDDLASVRWTLARTDAALPIDTFQCFDARLLAFLGGVPIEVELMDPYLLELHQRGATWWTAGPWVGH